MNYSINSIESRFCSKTMSNILNSIQLCENCNRIPLPSYRSYKQPEIILCKDCYFLHYKTFDYTILPSETEIKLIGQIVFSCMFSDRGCNEKFTLDSLQNLLFHEQKCNRNPNKTNFTRIKRQRYVNKIFKTEIEIIHDQIIKQELSFREKSKKLKDTIQSQGTEIILLKQSVESLKNQMDNQISVIMNKFSDKLEDILKFQSFKQEIQLNLTEIVKNHKDVNKKIEDKINSLEIDTYQKHQNFKTIEDKINTMEIERTNNFTNKQNVNKIIEDKIYDIDTDIKYSYQKFQIDNYIIEDRMDSKENATNNTLNLISQSDKLEDILKFQ